MSDGSSSSGEEEAGKAKAPKEEEEGPKGIDEASESSEESEEEKAEEKEEEEEGKATPTPQEKKKKRESSDESQTSEESDIDSETSSALFMAVRGVPGPLPSREPLGNCTAPEPSLFSLPPEEENAPQAGAQGLGQQLQGGLPAWDPHGLGGRWGDAAGCGCQAGARPPGNPRGVGAPSPEAAEGGAGTPLRQIHASAPLREVDPEQRGGAADRGGRAPVPVPQAHDHQGPAQEVPDQAHGAEQRRHRQRPGPAAQAPRPRAQTHRRQDALLPQGVGAPKPAGTPRAIPVPPQVPLEGSPGQEPQKSNMIPLPKSHGTLPFSQHPPTTPHPPFSPSPPSLPGPHSPSQIPVNKFIASLPPPQEFGGPWNFPGVGQRRDSPPTGRVFFWVRIGMFCYF
ncbi:hypothetical protein Nmel_008963 [Mimus melanotis]